ncbi:MAG: hypothetical protein KC646_04515 [Candidatus Cloacimonetes bacterium]|nr:hypothetical protein [Candidatus Cloacimonadota bacterium]
MQDNLTQISDNEIDQSQLDSVYEGFVDSVLAEGSSLIINVISNDELKGVFEEHYVISKEILPRITKLVNTWSSDFVSLIETLTRTIKVQIVADGNMVAQGRGYDLRVFFVDKLMHEPQGTIRFRLALIESDSFSYFNHEVIDEPHTERTVDLLDQDQVSSLVASLTYDTSIQKSSLSSNNTAVQKPNYTDQNLSLLELKTKECLELQSEIDNLKTQLRTQDVMYQKLITELEKSRVNEKNI